MYSGNSIRSGLQIAPVGIWRYSLLKADSLPLKGFDEPGEEVKSVLNLLRDEGILSRANRLLDAADGTRFTRLLGRIALVVQEGKPNRAMRDDIAFATQILFSLHYRNDTGKKAGLSLLSIKDDKPLFPDKYATALVDLTKNEVIINQDNGMEEKITLSSYIKPKFDLEDIDQFTFEIDLRKRFSLSKRTKEQLKIAMRSIGNQLIYSGSEGTKTQLRIIPFSVDFFVSEQKIKILEVHCPPRGIEMMSLPFRPFSTPEIQFPSDLYVSIVINEFRNCYKRLPNSVALCYPCSGYTFINRDTSRLAGIFEDQAKCIVHLAGPTPKMGWGVDEDDTIKVTGVSEIPDIVLFSDTPEHFLLTSTKQVVVPDVTAVRATENREYLWSRQTIDPQLTIQAELISKGENCPDFEKLSKKLGDWVVVKPEGHLPWWSPQKSSSYCKFLNLVNVGHQKQIKKLASKGPIILQSFFSSSLDNFGHFGELRIFGFVQVEQPNNFNANKSNG